MNGEQATSHVLVQLELHNVEYMLVGAFSSNAYGVPRATKDADIVVAFKDMGIVEFCECLGEGFVLDRQVLLEGFTGSTRNVVQHSASGFDIEFFHLGSDAHHQQRFARRIKLPINELNFEAWVPTAEDVVIQKLRWARRKDLDDVVNVLVVSGKQLDWKYLRRWTDEHETTELLEQLKVEAEE